jgi:hypothetical protein
MAKDKYHEQVKNALIKDGWTITHDPYKLKFLSKRNQNIDLGAEREVIGAEKGLVKIAVEVKSLVSESIVYSLYEALGQFLVYKSGLRTTDPNRMLYLAVAEGVIEAEIEPSAWEELVKEYQVNMIQIDLDTEQIKKWQP